MNFPTQVHEPVQFEPPPMPRALRPGWPPLRRAVALGPLPVRSATPPLRSDVRPPTPAARRNATGLALCMAGVAVVTALAVSSAYEPRSLGQRLDDGVSALTDAVLAWGTQLQAQLQRTADAAGSASVQAAQAVDTAVDDAAIHARIVTALLADPALQPSRIEVFVDAGHVRLQGTAPSAADKERARSLAQATAGVRAVDNRLNTP